jgi:hypothetical protein|tara:strand:+ start:605 stop:1033 length:429 start_codon:yes stop_codon:yes gene_type:complete
MIRKGKTGNLAYDDWETPKDFYDELNKEFNFDFDPCPLFSDFDGLNINWGKRNFVNPPYTFKTKEAFVKKAIKELKKGNMSVFILPVSTSTKLFHDYILPNCSEIRFVRGRIKFIRYKNKVKLKTQVAGVNDSMIVVFGKKN